MLGWRYASHRLYIDVSRSAADIGEGHKGYMFTFDYLQTVAGPRWFPELLLFLVAGLVIGAVGGMASMFAVRITARRWCRTVALSTITVVVGAGIGLIAVAYSRSIPPELLILPVTDPSFVLTDAMIAANPTSIYGAPKYVDASPELVYFPLAGPLCAVAISLILEAARRSITRSRA